MKINPFVGAAITSAMTAFVAVKVYDYYMAPAVDAAKDGIASVARAGLHVGVWTALFAALSMRGLSERIRGWRRGNRAFSERINPKGR